MSTESEGTFKIGNTSLYTKTWTPNGPVKARLVFVHGYSDHVNSYHGLFPSLASRGIKVYGFDQRGWGRSVAKPSDRGLTGPTSQVISDIAAFIEACLAGPGSDSGESSLPLFVMGNSMGGQQVLTLASDGDYSSLVSRIRGWILEAPFIAFAEGEEPSTLKVAAGRLVGRLLPRRQMVNPLKVELLSRDPAVVQGIRDDELCHDTGTLEGLAGMLDRTSNLSLGKVTLGDSVQSVFVAHGTADKITSYPKSKEWFEKQTFKDGKYKTYEGCYHQLHSDHCKEEFYKDVGDWILERCDGAAKAADPKL